MVIATKFYLNSTKSFSLLKLVLKRRKTRVKRHLIHVFHADNPDVPESW